ncbi:MAG TPA: sigma-70 family RNA polymerase sigma factor [Thermoanaerobaculia bacterium]|nr:sigma-70 family RNA polymerase sigma factor [Thermoanaerobaculia bacterium]
MLPGEDDARTSDLALIRRTAGGDPCAFESLVRRHQPAVFRFISLLIRDGLDPEEILTETFLAARRTLPRYREDTPVRSWLLGLARQILHRRDPRPQRQIPDAAPLRDLGEAAGWGRPTNDGERLAERLADRGFLERTLAALPPDDREILILRDLEGLPGEEAAAVAGLTEAAARNRLLRARLRLVAKLKEGLDDGR